MPRFSAKIAVVEPPSVEHQRDSEVQVNGDRIKIIQQYADIIEIAAQSTEVVVGAVHER